MAQSGPGVSEVANDANWRNRVKTEYGVGKVWKKNWGFLAAQPSRSSDALDELMLSTAKMHSCNSYIAANLRDTILRKHDTNDSIDNFVDTYVKAHGGPRLMPKQEFKRPVLASHTYGWRPTLETFGRVAIVLR